MSCLRNVGGIGALGVLLTSLGCGGSTASTTTAPTPTEPAYEIYTDTFSDGTVLQGSTADAPDFGPAGSPHRFTIHKASSANPGLASVTITSLNPLSTITVGLGLTTWNATTENCDLPLLLTTFTAKVGVPLEGGVFAPRDLCVAVFDVGNILGSSTYVVTIVHN